MRSGEVHKDPEITRLPAPWQRQGQGLDAVVQRWLCGPLRHDMRLNHLRAARAEQAVELPAELAPNLRAALQARGIDRLYSHQLEAFELARDGNNVVIATPTASGKSLCYNLPVLQAFSEDPSTRALYLFPTKALSRDQEQALHGLFRDAQVSCGVITYDGDTPGDARRVARQRAGVVLTNPDMLHAGILPHHTAWARLFANLRYVVIDELHTYRGVFGSHLANVLRRLSRVARFHGSEPAFLFTSATIGNPQEHAARICGRPVDAVLESGAPAGPKRVMVYNPPIVNAELGIRASYIKTAVKLTHDLVQANVSTLVFGQSRNGVEVMLKYLRDRLRRQGYDPEMVHAYRGGYLPQMRRRIEQRLRAGEIRCVVATNALELGIDIGSLDAVVCAGYPGTMAALWQRFGRAGRRLGPSLAVLVPSSMPVDQYIAQHAQDIVGGVTPHVRGPVPALPVEQARIDPDNVEILIQHLKCGAFELPFEPGDLFGDLPVESLHDALGYLDEHGVVHATDVGDGQLSYHWIADSYPASHVSLRSAGGENFVVVDLATNATIAEMDWHSAHTMLHEQAIYQHTAQQFQVERLDYHNHKAYVRKVEPDYYTTAMTNTKVTVLEVDRREGGPRLLSGLGDVSVIEKVVGFKKIKYHTHENVGCGEVHLPEIQKHTTAYWLTFPEAFVQGRPEPRPVVVDALRGLSKAMHLIATVGLMIDAHDLGVTVIANESAGSERREEQDHARANFDPTIFLYDQPAGGIGLAPRLYEDRESLLWRARRLIQNCPCVEGCPGCIGPVLETVASHALTPPKALVLDLLHDLGVQSIH